VEVSSAQRFRVRTAPPDPSPSQRRARFLEFRLERYPQRSNANDAAEQAKASGPRVARDLDDEDEDEYQWVAPARPGDAPRLPLATALAHMSCEPLSLTQLGQLKAMAIMGRRAVLVEEGWPLPRSETA